MLFRIRLFPELPLENKAPPTPCVARLPENVLLMIANWLFWRCAAPNTTAELALKVVAEMSSGAEFMMNSAPPCRAALPWNVLRSIEVRRGAMLAVLNSAPASPVARLPVKVEPQTITSVSSEPSIKIAPPFPPAPPCPGPLTPGQLATSGGAKFGLRPLAALPVNSLL